jgi:hypothetical protein
MRRPIRASPFKGRRGLWGRRHDLIELALGFGISPGGLTLAWNRLAGLRSAPDAYGSLITTRRRELRTGVSP